MILQRRPPAPIPAIHPIPEYLADAELAAKYRDMKVVLQVPWMGVVTMALAHYRCFYDTLWNGIRPLCRSVAFVKACQDLRASVEEAVAKLNPPPIAGRLAAIGYAPPELEAIRTVIETFSHGNFRYLVIATLARLLLEGQELNGGEHAPEFIGESVPPPGPLVLMEMHHADAPTRLVFADLMATLGLPFVNTDYRALARWPSYFAIAWQDLKPSIGTAAHEGLATELHERTIAAVHALPNPRGLKGNALRAAAHKDAPDSAAVLETGRLFHWLLPALVINVAFFRHQLDGAVSP